MNSRILQISIILVTLVVSGCFGPPVFPDNPVIGYESLTFGSDPENRRDSMLLTFRIEDGNGDIGLDERELGTPYHPYNVIVDSRDSLVTLTDVDVVPPLYAVDPMGNRRLFSEDDSRPAYECESYAILEYRGENDTFFIEQNEYHNNIYIDFLKKENGDYRVLDFSEELGIQDCGLTDFDGRIPIFDSDNLGRSLSGTISYTMPTSLTGMYQFLLQRDTFRLRFYIYDRALTKSNVVETPDLTLPDITR